MSPSCDSGRCSPVEPVSLSPDSVQRDISSGYISMNDKNSEYGDDIVYTYINIGDDAFEFTKEPQKKPIKTTNLTLEILERRKANLPYEDLLIKHCTNQSNNDDFLDRPRPPKEVYLIKYSRKQTSKDSPDNPYFSQVHDKDDEQCYSNNSSLGENSLNGELEASNIDCKNAASDENLPQDTNLALYDKSCLKYKRKSHKKALGSDKNNRNGISSDESCSLSVSSSSHPIQQPDLSPSIVFKRQLHSKDFSSNEDETFSKCTEDYGSKTKFSVDQPKISPSIQFKRQLHNKEFTSTDCSRDDKVVKKYQRKASSKVNQDKNGDSTDFQANAEDSGSKSESSLDQPEISQSIKLKRLLQSKAFISSDCNGDEVVKKYHRKLVITNDKNEALSDCKDIPKDYASKSELSVHQPEISQSIKLKRQLQSKAFSSNVCNEGEVVKKYQRKVINKLHRDEDKDLSCFQDIPKACDLKDKLSVDQTEISQSIKLKRQLHRKFISAVNSNGGCFDQKFS